jgi:hypothetical protein
MVSHWSAFVDAKTTEAARRILKCLETEFGRSLDDVSINPNTKTGGHKSTFYVRLVATTWNDAVVEIIELGQRVARAWELTGSIVDEIEASSNRPRVAGVSMITVSLRREADLK